MAETEDSKSVELAPDYAAHIQPALMTESVLTDWNVVAVIIGNLLVGGLEYPPSYQMHK